MREWWSGRFHLASSVLIVYVCMLVEMEESRTVMDKAEGVSA
jgi:hypothetical protein